MAAGTRPPDASVMVPTTFAVVAWGNIGETASTRVTASNNKTRIILTYRASFEVYVESGNEGERFAVCALESTP